MIKSVYKRVVFCQKMSSLNKMPRSTEVNNHSMTIKESKELVEAFGRKTVEKALATAPSDLVRHELRTLLKEADEFDKIYGAFKAAKHDDEDDDDEEKKNRRREYAADEEMKGSDCGASATNL